MAKNTALWCSRRPRHTSLSAKLLDIGKDVLDPMAALFSSSSRVGSLASALASRAHEMVGYSDIALVRQELLVGLQS